jgi:hypothetical protein
LIKLPNVAPQWPHAPRGSLKVQVVFFPLYISNNPSGSFHFIHVLPSNFFIDFGASSLQQAACPNGGIIAAYCVASTRLLCEFLSSRSLFRFSPSSFICFRTDKRPTSSLCLARALAIRPNRKWPFAVKIQPSPLCSISNLFSGKNILMSRETGVYMISLFGATLETLNFSLCNLPCKNSSA